MQIQEKTYIDQYGNKGKLKKVKDKDYKKYKIKKTIKRLIALELSLTMIFSAGKFIFKDNNKNNLSYKNSTSQTYVSKEPSTSIPDVEQYYTYSIERGEDDEVPFDGFTTLNVNLKDIEEFKNYLNNKEVKYTYEDLYNIEDAYNNYKAKSISKLNSSPLVINGKLDSNALYNQVLKNNEVYYNDKQNNSARAFYDELKDKEIKDICVVIADVINYEVSKNKDLDIYSVCKNLEYLKIFEDNTTPSNAYVNNKMCLLINKDFINKIFKLYNGGRDCYDEVIVHEIMHLIQYKSSNLDNADGIEIGPFVSYVDSDKVNPLNITWILESNAEQEMSNYTRTDITTYTNQVGYLKSTNLALSIGNDSANNIYTVSFAQSWNDIYNIFDAKSDKQKKEVIKCLYSIEVSQVTDKNFYKAYEAKYDVDITSDNNLKTNVKKTCAREALLALSKIFYINICDNLNGKNFTMEDVFYLIRVWESDLLYHLNYNSEEEYIKCKDFIKNYNEMQEKFFNVIAKSIKEDVEYVYNEYNNYSMKSEIGNNYLLSHFAEEKKSFIYDMRLNRYNKGNPRLSQIKSIMKNKGEETAKK